MVLVKKRQKPVEIATKRIETMASRLTILAAIYPKSSSITWNRLLNPQVLQSIWSRNEKIDGLEKAEL